MPTRIATIFLLLTAVGLLVEARADYVLPSANLMVDGSGIWRPDPARVPDVPVSDHFPVWMDVRVEP